MKPMTPLRFYDFMRSGHVKRWHIVNTVRDQTIAEHQYLVTIIALELYTRMNLPPNKPEILLALVASAMFSDAPEVRYGDYPTPAKKHIKAVGGDDLFDKLDKQLMPCLPYTGGMEHGIYGVLDYVHMADAIEAAHWISENKAGIHSDVVAKGANRRMVEKAVQLGWLEPVNQILIELGMPYISESMLQTPP